MTIYLAGGCFWGVQKFLDQFRGVQKTEVGTPTGGPRTRLMKTSACGTPDTRRP